MYKRIILLFVCIVALHLVIYAQINTRNFYPILSNAYQDRQAFSILRDDDGFMWFVNDYGISRYDGNHIKSYRINTGWRAFLKKNNKGEIFVCYASGNGFKYNELTDSFDSIFNVFQSDLKSGTFILSKQIQNNQKQSNKLRIEVTAIDIDQWNNLWISTPLGIVCYDSDNDKWLDYKYQKLNIHYLLQIKDKLYLFSNIAIYSLDLTNKNLKEQKIKKIANLNTNDKIISAYFDEEEGNLYWGTFNKGLFQMTKNREIKQLISIQNSPVRSIKKYGRDIILVGVDGLGIYEYNVYTRKIVAYQKSDENNLGSLSSNGIYDIYVDADKRIWVATYSKGVNVYDPNLIYFKKISHLINVPNSLANNYVNAIIEDKYQNLWFATNNGISIKNKIDGSWKHILNNNSSIEKNAVVLSLCKSNDGNIWAGGFGFGLKKINQSSLKINTIDLFKKSNESLNNYIFSLVNQESTIWACGVSNKLFSIQQKSLELAQYPKNGIRLIAVEDNNHLLLLTNSHLYSFNVTNGRIDLKLDSLIKTNEKVRSIQYIALKRDDDNLWIGTSQSGLIRYSYSKNIIEVFNLSDGLPSNNIISIELDNTNCLWLGTDEGLCYFNPSTKIGIPFKTQDGSEKGIFNNMASLKRSDGSLVFGTKQGAFTFDPASFLVSPSRGSLVWTDFYIYNQEKDARKNEEIFKKGLNKTDEIVLHYHENSFKIGFQELNYNQSIYTRYSYYLKGYDKEFCPLSNESSASFYNLMPGKYNLSVRSYFADKEGKFMERNISIIINQPWWNTIWAWIVWISLLLVVGFGVYRYISKRQERRYSDEKIRFFINVSHDMRTPITLIKAPLGDLINDNSLSHSSRYLVHTINNNVNRLFEMINRILDFEKSDEEQMRLFPKEYELNKYVQEVTENFQSYAEINGITLSSKITSEPIIVCFDRIKMDMIVENLMSNAIKYSKQGGYVKVIAGSDNKNWWIEVQDNGIGIPSNEQKRIFKRFFRAENAINSKQIGSGMGLLLVNNLTKFMGGSAMFESEEGVKTTFRIKFSLPVTNNVNMTQNLMDFNQLDQPYFEENETPSILFVDDNDEIRNYISNRLRADYTVITADGATAALQILQSNKINIIVSDIMMPGISGIEFCEKLKADSRFSHIPVILLSALSDKKDILKGLQIGADDYITKPFDSNFFKQRIDNILENRKRLKQYFLKNKGNITQLSKESFINELDKLFLGKLDRIVETNMSNSEYTIDILCRDIGMSRTVFYNKLKNLTEISPNDYLRIKRLEKAAELLATHKYAVVEVAEMVGYNDVKHFSSIFTKKYGCAPSKYFC